MDVILDSAEFEDQPLDSAEVLVVLHEKNQVGLRLDERIVVQEEPFTRVRRVRVSQR